jgi:aromatic ring-cleaving dioxygenase
LTVKKLLQATLAALLVVASVQGAQLVRELNPAIEVVDGYDIHVYFDPQEAPKARSVFERFVAYMQAEQAQTTGVGFYPEVFDRSPHPKPMWEVDLPPQQQLNEKLGTALAWLMLNRDGLTVLIHPNTSPRNRASKIMDHSGYTAWLGEPVPINLDPAIYDD